MNTKMSKEDKAATAEVLLDSLAKFSERDQGFVLSLLGQLKTKGDLSEKQWFWANKLAGQVMATVKSAGEVELEAKVSVGDLGPIKAMLAKAAAHLKWPKIEVIVQDLPLTLHVSGQMSKYPGTVQVKSAGTWCGRIDDVGMEFSQKLSPEQKSKLTAALQAFAADPAGCAAAHGHLTGRCCFCRSSLSDEKSTAVGYGPVCAKRYGLAWGTSAPVLANKVLTMTHGVD